MKINGKYHLSQYFLTPLSPFSGLICALTFTLGTIFSQSLIPVSIFFTLAFALTLYNHILKQIVPLLLSTNSFMLIVWLTLPFTMDENPIFILPSISFSLSYTGIYLACLLTLKTNTVLLFFVNLVSIEPHKFGKLLQTIGIPDKLIILFILLYQNTTFLYKDMLTTLQSLSLRMQKSNILLSLKLYAYLIGTILVHNIDRANHIRMVLERRTSPLLYVEQVPLYSSYIDIFFPLVSLVFTITISYYFL